MILLFAKTGFFGDRTLHLATQTAQTRVAAILCIGIGGKKDDYFCNILRRRAINVCGWK